MMASITCWTMWNARREISRGNPLPDSWASFTRRSTVSLPGTSYALQDMQHTGLQDCLLNRLNVKRLQDIGCQPKPAVKGTQSAAHAEILTVLLCGLAWPFSVMVTLECLCSPTPQERLGGILAIDELIDVKVSSGSWMRINGQPF